MKLRISKTKILIAVAIFLPLTLLTTSLLLNGVATEAAFQQLREIKANDRRCVACSMDYNSYHALMWASVLFLNVFFGGAIAAGVVRAFGPPTLIISSDGRGRYWLPWLRREFHIPEGAHVDLTRFGLIFTPALLDEASGRSFTTIPIRSHWMDRSTETLMRDLRALNATWIVSRR